MTCSTEACPATLAALMLKTWFGSLPCRVAFWHLALLCLGASLAGCGAGSIPGNTPPAATALSISAITPKEVPAGSGPVTVTVTGTGFTPQTVIVLSGVDEPTTYISSTQVQATVPAAQLKTGSVFHLSVRNGAVAADAPSTTNFQVDNPIPTIANLSPTAALLGTANATVSVNGTNFVSGIVVTVNGNPLPTTLVSATQVTAVLPAQDLAEAGTLLFNVSNPQPGGGASGTAPFTVNNPAPAITGISPSVIQVGATGTVVTVSGTGFLPSTGVLINGMTRPAKIVSASTMTVALSAADQAAPGTLNVTAVNPNPGGGVSGSAALSVNNPAPGTLTLTPASLIAGANGATQLKVAGSGFVASTIIEVNGDPRPSTYVSSTQMVATISSADQANAGVLHVTAVNGAPGGGTSPVGNLSVENPAPGGILVSPNMVSTGAQSATTITVTGANFVPNTVVQVNGSSRPTTFVSSTDLTASLTVADQATAGSLAITAFTPTPGGGTSSTATVAVNTPTLGFISLDPSTVASGGQNTTITVNGSGFVSGTTIQVNGAARATTYNGPTQLTFTLLAADLASPGRLAVVASNPAPSSSVSQAATLTVAPPDQTPSITTLNPTSFVAGTPSTSISVMGTNFSRNSVVQWNSTALATTFINSTYLAASVSADLLASTGSATVTVTNPTAPTPTSNGVAIQITTPPAPTLTSMYPNNGAFNTATQLSLFGTGFSAASTVNLNGQALTPTYNSPNSLTVSVPASSLPLPGNYSVTVTTPAPGGGTTAAQVYTAYIPLTNNDAIYNPTDGLIYASVPGSVPAPMGNSVVAVNPATGAISTPIFVGSEPNKLALTSDGKYLWVGLDGASAVRKVDLVARTAGLQFSLPSVNGGIYQSPATALSLAALPNATDSVIVGLSSTTLTNAVGLVIFDSGVARANTAQTTIYNNQVSAIRVDATRHEIYAGGFNSYATYTYNSSGLTQLATVSTISPANTAQDEMQLLSGKILTDFGQIFDAEAGALLGTLYVSGNTVAQGAALADQTLGKIFVLDNSSGYAFNGATQVQLFNLSDYTSANTVIPVNVTGASRRLTRWGANGLAFQTPTGIYSLQSNAVVDLSSTSADLGLTLSSSGATSPGGNTTYTAQIKNNGPSTASDVIVTTQLPTTGVLASVTTDTGSCSAGNGITCSLGSMANSATATVVFTILQTTAGTSTLAAQVTGSTADAVATNNAASSTVTITGADYSVAPALTAIAPAAIQTGTPTDTTVTVTGTGFSSTSTVMLGSTALATTFVSATQLKATVPASSATAMGWSPLTVATPAPGGGTSSPLPLTFYDVLTIGVNHILYDPYSRQIMASVGSGSSTVTGNSIAAIDPTTGAVATPVSIGSQPTQLALSSDGQILYTILAGSQSVARYNMLTGQADYTYQVPTTSNFVGGIALRGIAVQPGTENTIALDLASYTGNAIYDFDPVHKTAAIRGQASGPYTGSCLAFLDASTLLAFDTDTSGSSLDRYTVTSTGFTYYNYSQYTVSTLSHFGCFKLSGGLAFANGGGIANPATTPATQVATLAGASGSSFYDSQALAPDASLQRAFYPAINPNLIYNLSGQDGITVFDLNTFQPSLTLPLNMPAIEGNSDFSQVDIIRWGQDGLALLTSTGHIYLLRGPAIVPGLLSSGQPAASLGSVSSSTLATGSGNVLLTLTGSGFAPGVAVTWNGSYRTTTILDATHVTVAIPASDLAAAGSATLVATNPGASGSNSLTVTVQ